jgi:hypothetical protein
VTVPASADSPVSPSTWAILSRAPMLNRGKLELGLGGVVAAERGLAVEVEFGALQPGGAS